MGLSIETYVCLKTRERLRGGAAYGGVLCVNTSKIECVYYENVIVIVKDYCQVSLKEIYEFLQKKKERRDGERERSRTGARQAGIISLEEMM